jgi:thioredoxin 1
MYIVKDAADYDAILKNNHSVFVDFYADWCGPCKMLGPVVEQLADENRDVTFIKVNVDQCPDVAERYGFMSIPTLISFKDGVQAAATVGFQPKEELLKLVKAAE